MKIKLLIYSYLLSLITFSTSLLAQSGAELCSQHKIISMAKAKKLSTSYFPGDASYDMVHTDLSLKINHLDKSLEGIAINTIKPFQDIKTLFFDLKVSLRVDSVKFDGKKINFTHLVNKITCNFDVALEKDKLHKISIFYKGTPANSAFGSFSLSTHGADKVPVIWSLSEPYGAPDWWPCKDELLDKLDSSRVSLTADAKYTSVSNGKLEKTINNADGTKTFTWKNSYPIAHYLVSIASTNYAEYNRTFIWNGKSMPINHYVYPEALNANVRAQLDLTTNMLTFFSNTFGEYPFINERYGHAQCNFGGGMEHQTVSSMGSFGERLVAHELAHQWFGDKITCKTWSDIFVNEAFAAYSEALWIESRNGKTAYTNAMTAYENSAKTANSPIKINNPSNENLIFNYNTTYAKGATVLHMLRWEIGDEAFFKSLKNYMSSSMAYGVASITDFMKIAQEASGKNLETFFEQWTVGTTFPKFTTKYTKVSEKIFSIKVGQEKLSTKPEFYKLRLPVGVYFSNGTDTTLVFDVSGETTEIIITSGGKQIQDIVVDPNKWIMETSSYLGGSSLALGTETETENEFLVYPNPAEKYLNVSSTIKDYHIFNEVGKVFQKGEVINGKINIEKLNSGNYYLKMYNGKEESVQKIVKR